MNPAAQNSNAYAATSMSRRAFLSPPAEAARSDAEPLGRTDARAGADSDAPSSTRSAPSTRRGGAALFFLLVSSAADPSCGSAA